MKFSTYILLMLLLILNSCKKDKITYSEIPEIEFLSVSPQVVTEFEDDLTFTIKYLDGDGDLGENNPDVVNLFLSDQRINITHEFRINQLSPSGSSIPIAGQLNVVLKGLGITDGSIQQAATFSIYVVDRAGNVSNTVVSNPVTIKKP